MVVRLSSLSDAHDQKTGEYVMPVFTLFFCIAGANTCQAHGASHATIEACYESGQRVTGQAMPPANGRLMTRDGNWYEGRKKYLDSLHR
jgi:hypothetical protein